MRHNLHASFLSQPREDAPAIAVLLGVRMKDALLTVVEEHPVGQLRMGPTIELEGWPMALLPSRGPSGVWVMTATALSFLTPDGRISTVHTFERRLWGPTTLTANTEGTRLAIGTPFRLITLQVDGDRVRHESWWHPASCRVLDDRCRCHL